MSLIFSWVLGGPELFLWFWVFPRWDLAAGLALKLGVAESSFSPTKVNRVFCPDNSSVIAFSIKANLWPMIGYSSLKSLVDTFTVLIAMLSQENTASIPLPSKKWNTFRMSAANISLAVLPIVSLWKMYYSASGNHSMMSWVASASWTGVKLHRASLTIYCWLFPWNQLCMKARTTSAMITFSAGALSKESPSSTPSPPWSISTSVDNRKSKRKTSETPGCCFD